MKYITKREMERIREKALTTRMYKGLTAYIIIETLANTGIRVHELIQMTPNDLLEKQIIIRGKGNKIRNIDVSPSFLFILKIHVKQKMIPPAEKIFDISRNGVYKLCKKVSGLNLDFFNRTISNEQDLFKYVINISGKLVETPSKDSMWCQWIAPDFNCQKKSIKKVLKMNNM